MACYLFLLLGRKHPYYLYIMRLFKLLINRGLLALNIILCCVADYLNYDPFTSDVIAAGGFAELGCGGGAVKE